MFVSQRHIPEKKLENQTQKQADMEPTVLRKWVWVTFSGTTGTVFPVQQESIKMFRMYDAMCL